MVTGRGGEEARTRLAVHGDGLAREGGFRGRRWGERACRPWLKDRTLPEQEVESVDGEEDAVVLASGLLLLPLLAVMVVAPVTVAAAAAAAAQTKATPDPQARCSSSWPA